MIDSILAFIAELFGRRRDHSDRVTAKATSGIVTNNIHVETLGKKVYLTGQLRFNSGAMPSRSALTLGILPADLVPYNNYAIVFSTYGQYQADVIAQVRMVIGDRSLQFYNAGTGTSAAEIFYYATWELEQLPQSGTPVTE